MARAAGAPTREWIARSFTHVEDVLYVALGVLLSAGALVLLGDATRSFVTHLLAGTLPGRIIDLLDRVLLVLMFAEILYTVQVSFREHSLVPEPFLVVGLIAAIRRVLVITAEFGDLMENAGEKLQSAMLELGLLTVLVLVLVASLVLLRRRPTMPSAER
ncbi:MAG TPA: phosphate-starvation-inducible PsiE family protein [Methylomirabilota bacterium]|nr:phosphate-starvation-inducible PsiE family protein [Methylomirabilota bacterium]